MRIIKCIMHENIKSREAQQTIMTTVKTNKNTAYEKQYTLQIIVKLKITIFTKGVPQYNHSLLMLFKTLLFRKLLLCL